MLSHRKRFLQKPTTPMSHLSRSMATKSTHPKKKEATTSSKPAKLTQNTTISSAPITPKTAMEVTTDSTQVKRRGRPPKRLTPTQSSTANAKADPHNDIQISTGKLDKMTPKVKGANAQGLGGKGKTTTTAQAKLLKQVSSSDDINEDENNFFAARPAILHPHRKPQLSFSDAFLRPLVEESQIERRANGVITAGRRDSLYKHLAFMDHVFQCTQGQYSEGDFMLGLTSPEMGAMRKEAIRAWIGQQNDDNNGGHDKKKGQIKPEDKFGSEYDSKINRSGVIWVGSDNDEDGDKDENADKKLDNGKGKGKKKTTTTTTTTTTTILDIPVADIEDLTSDPYNTIRSMGYETLVDMYQHRQATKAQKQSIVRWYLRSGRRTRNWNIVDVSCYKILGNWLIEREDERGVLMDLTVGGDFWEQRIAIVSTMALIKTGQFDNIFELADWHLRPQIPTATKGKMIGGKTKGVVGEVWDEVKRVAEVEMDKLSKARAQYALPSVKRSTPTILPREITLPKGQFDWAQYPMSTARSSVFKNVHNRLIHRAIGWMLREVGKKDRDSLDKWLTDHNRFLVIPQHTYSYCLEHHSPEEKEVYLRKKIKVGCVEWFIPVDPTDEM